jgi:predicted nucleic acid-binding protein
MRYLIDTCVLSETRRKKPNKGVVDWLAETDEERLFISVVTLMEIQKGIVKLDDGPRRQAFQTWLDEDLSSRFKGRILGLTQDVALEWGVLLGTHERRGEKLPLIDSLLASTAIQYNLTLVTRNTSDFGRTPARILNPWH